MRSNQVTLKLMKIDLSSEKYSPYEINIYGDSDNLYAAIKLSLECLYHELKQNPNFKCQSWTDFIAEIAAANRDDYIASTISSTRLGEGKLIEYKDYFELEKENNDKN